MTKTPPKKSSSKKSLPARKPLPKKARPANKQLPKMFLAWGDAVTKTPSKKSSSKKSPSKKSRPANKPLPKTYRGAAVVRGAGMNSDKLDTFVERHALDQFDAARDMWIVVEDRALEDLDDSVEVKGFATKDDALVYAQARANGNVDHRVLRVTDQVLVVATMNEL